MEEIKKYNGILHYLKHCWGNTTGIIHSYVVVSPINGKDKMIAHGLACNSCGYVNPYRIEYLNDRPTTHNFWKSTQNYISETTMEFKTPWITENDVIKYLND